MASGWGGLNDIIEEALERKRKEDEEKRKAEEVKRALEKYRAGERQSQEPVQGPRPAPAPLPNPWEKPVFSQPAPSPVTAIPQPSPLQQYQGPSVDIGPTDIGGGQSHSDTVQSRLPQPSMPTVQPRSLSPDLAVSTSDRLRDNYNAPNRPIVPTSPQGPAANPWQAPTFGQPQAQYQLQPDEQAPVTQQNILNTQGEWTNWLGDRAQALGQAITSVPDQLNDWWQQTPGGQYFNQTVQQRDSYVPPTIPQAVNNILGNALSADTTLGKVAGVAALPVTGAIPIIDAYSGVIPGMRGVIKGGANALSFLNELGMEAANEPWLQGYSPAEIINADLAGAIAGMKATSGMENYAPTMEKFGVFSPAFDAARTEYLVKSGEFRKQVTGLVEQGQTQANMALRNLPSGYNAAQSTLDNLVNRDQKVAQLQKQAIDAQNAGDFLQAGEYFRQAQELQNMTSVEMVEQNMNPGVEFLYGMIFDPTNFVGPFMELAHLTPEASAVRKATRAVRNAETGNTLEKLKNAVYGGERLTQALAEGTKAGQKVYQEIITPYQNAVEKAQNATVLLARTRESKAALDAEAIWQGLAGILANITSKQDTKIVLETLLTEPGKLVTGLNNLSQEAMIRLANSQGFAQWGKGVFNDDFARRLALLVPARDEILGMKSLQGEGLAKSYEVLAELNGIVVDYARRANGAKLPTRLPFGASKVDILRLGQDSAVITYLNKNGDVVQRGIETTLSEAQRRLNEINKALKNAGKKGILDYARIPADIQRAIMSDTWLGMRPANWIGNALGATTGLFANDAYTLLPLSKMQDDIAKKFGGVLGNRRMQDVIQPEADMVRGAKQEMGSGFLDNLARAVTRNPDNVVSRGMKKLYDIPYGKTEIKLPGGLAIPFGEEAFYTRAFYVPFSRAFAGGIAESINRDLVPVLQTIEGMSPQAIQRVGDWVTNLAINGSRSDVAQGIRKYVGKPTIRMTLKSLGVPPELLTPQAAYAIENLIMDAAPSELERIWFGVHGVPGVEDMDGIRDILAKERNPAASVLNIAGSQPGIYDWTDVDIAEEAAHLADGLARDAQKAGVEVTQAAQEAQKIATDYLQGQQNTFKRVLDDLSSQPNKPDTWSVTMDFWQDVNIIKNKARRYVDELGKRATQVNTPEAWQQKWRGTQEIYTSLQKQLSELADEARLNLQAVANGSEYTPKYNWWETIEGYLQWDEEAFRQARTIELGSPDAADMAQWQEVITRNREYIDNSVYELFGAFQRYPSLENFDIVRHGMQKLEAMGAQVRYNLDQMLDKLVAGEISKEAYAKARNLAWNNYFDAGVQYNNALGQAIVRNGVLTEAGVDLKWTQDGIEFQLTRPSTTPNKFWARNLQTGVEEEFTAAQTADEMTPFTVPKSVIDDFNRLVGNEAAIDEATAAVMQEISDSAPEVIRPTRTEPATVEGLVNEGLRPPRMEPEVTWMEPDVEQNVPGYNGAGARRAEPLPEEIPSTAAQERAAYYDEEVGRWVEEQRARRAAAGTEEEVPEEAPRSRRRVPSAWYEDAEGNRVPVYQDELDNAVEPVAPVEEQAAPTIPANDDIRAAASDAGIATATKTGRPTDKHLVNSLNKRMGTSVRGLDDLSDEQRIAAVDALRARKEEQVSRMSSAEAQKAVKEAVPAPVAESKPATLTDYGRGRRVEEPVAVEFSKPRTYNGVQEITGAVEGAGVRIEGERVYIIQHAKGSNTYYVNTRPTYAEGGRTIGSNLSLSEAKKIAADYLQEGARTERGFGQGIQVEATVGRETLPLATGKPPKKVPDKVFGKPFDRMSSKEILAETRDELIAAGYTDQDLADLAKNREDLLGAVADARGVDVNTLDNMKRYDFSVPSVAQLLGMETPEEAVGKTIRDWINRSRKLGNNAAPQMGDVAEHTIRNLNDLERTLRARLPQILAGSPNELTGAQRLRVVDAVLDWLPNFDNELTRAQKVGDRMANWVMLNYQDRRNLDTIANLLMIPFHYYWSRMPSRTLMMSLQKPALVNFYYEALRSIALENEQAGVPERLRGTLPNPLHQYGIGNERFNASAYLRYIIPYTSYAPSPYVEEDPTATGVNLWTQRLQKWNFPLGPLTLAILDMLDGNMDAYYGDILNNMIPVFGVPVSSIYQGWTGNMPAKNGVMAKFGFGPDTTDDGFGLDAYRARRAVEWIANEEDIDPVLMGYANQVILNQYNGDPIDKDVDPAYLDAAIELAQRGVKRAAGDRMESRATAYTMIGSTQPYPEAEQQVNQGRGQYYASGYDPMTNPNGSDALQNNILDADPNIARSWVKSSETPGIDAQISQLYDEAQANGNWDVVMPQIEALKAQQNRPEPLPQPQPTAGSMSDILRGSYGDAYKGMNPQEQLEALQKEAANKYWDEYLALEDNAEKAKYLRENPEFAEIYKQNIIDKGEEPEDWWSDYPEPGGKKATSKKGAAGTSASSGVSGDNGLPPGSVTRDDFSEEELDQLYGEYLGFNEEKDWDGQKAWLLDHPEFARLEADRKLEKDGEYPWWYDDVFGEDGAAVRGAASIRNIPSHPTSIADVLRQPYDYAEAGKWAKDRERSSGYSKDSGKGVSGDWSTEWDEYRALGEDWEAKRQYMLDHPEFAKYYIGKYGDDAAWWLEWEERTGTGYGGRSHSYYGGGGGGGGSPYLGGSYTSYHNAQVAPRYFDRSLWEAPRFQPWIPYSRPNPDWLQAGRELAPEPIRKWIPPRWS